MRVKRALGLLRRLRPRHLPRLPLAVTVAASELTFRRARARRSRPAEPLSWRPGLSVVIPERGAPAMLAPCLHRLAAALTRVGEPTEVIVVVNGSTLEAYTSLRQAHPTVRWLEHPEPLGFTGAVLRGLDEARHGAVYLLNNDMLLEAEALGALLPWRGPQVFAVASQIFFQDPGRRREETGWTSMAIEHGLPWPRHEEPRGATVCGTVYAGAGAALFHAEMLRRLMAHSRPFDPFYWEDVDLCVRAWRLGYESLFCPASVAQHKHRATVERYYDRAEVQRIFERNRILFQLRNPFPRQNLTPTLELMARLDRATLRELGSGRACRELWRERWRAFRAPYRDLGYPAMWAKRHFRPPASTGRPCLVIVSPFAVLPAVHGGAVRIERLAAELARDFDVVLLSDEADLYGNTGGGPFASLHPVGGRPPEPAGQERSRVARICSHSHRALGDELRRIVELYRPAAVLVEHIELAGLIDAVPQPRPPFILTLQDVLLEPGDPEGAEADRFEGALMDRFDGLVVCSAEDQALLGARACRLVPNGVDAGPAHAYTPSASQRTILFVGPFRAQNNWDGIHAFLERAYPAVEAAVPGVALTVLGGPGARARAAGEPCFHRASVTVLDTVEDVRPLLDACAVTINPQPELRGSSLKVIESIAAGRTCVSTRAGARGWLDPPPPGLVAVERVEDFVPPLVRLLGDERYRLAREEPEPEWLAACAWEPAGRTLRDYVREVIAGTVERRGIDAKH